MGRGILEALGRRLCRVAKPQAPVPPLLAHSAPLARSTLAPLACSTLALLARSTLAPLARSALALLARSTLAPLAPLARSADAALRDALNAEARAAGLHGTGYVKLVFLKCE